MTKNSLLAACLLLGFSIPGGSNNYGKIVPANSTPSENDTADYFLLRSKLEKNMDILMP